MTTLPTLQIIMTDKNYYQIAADLVQEYSDQYFDIRFF